MDHLNILSEGFWVFMGTMMGGAIGGFTTYFVAKQSGKIEMNKNKYDFLMDTIKSLEREYEILVTNRETGEDKAKTYFSIFQSKVYFFTKEDQKEVCLLFEKIVNIATKDQERYENEGGLLANDEVFFEMVLDFCFLVLKIFSNKLSEARKQIDSINT